MLSAEQEKLWHEYVAAEGDRIRSVLIPTLDRFLTSLAKTPIEEWKDWAYGIARRHADEHDPFPIRLALFTGAVFPALVHGLRRGEPNCARWLSGFTNLIAHREECQLALADVGWSQRSLLRLAVKQHSEDVRARGQLIEGLSSYLEYTVHELPSGVLYDQDGADAEKCLELEQCLAEFVELARAHGVADKYRDLVADCQYHYRHYPLYLAAQTRYGNYEGYLKAREGR